jgi:hypothetical protein
MCSEGRQAASQGSFTIFKLISMIVYGGGYFKVLDEYLPNLAFRRVSRTAVYQC